MNFIIINKDISVRIDIFNWQTSPNGKNFRLSGIRKNSQLPAKWIGNTYKWHWLYDFIYEEGKKFSIEIDYNNKFVQLIKQ